MTAQPLPTFPTGAVYVFRFPLPDLGANARYGHWAVKHRAQKKYFELCDNRVLVKLLPKPMGQPFARGFADVTLQTVRRMDTDNAHSRLKWVWDWLTSRGYLAGDDPDRLRYVLHAVTGRKSNAGVEVRLIEVPADWPMPEGDAR